MRRDGSEVERRKSGDRCYWNRERRDEFSEMDWVKMAGWKW